MIKVKLNELEYNLLKCIMENHPTLGPLKRTPEYYCDIYKTSGGFDAITHQNITEAGKRAIIKFLHQLDSNTIDQLMIDVGFGDIVLKSKRLLELRRNSTKCGKSTQREIKDEEIDILLDLYETMKKEIKK